MIRVLFAVFALFSAGKPASAQIFSDPAPPTVQKLAEMAPPEPRKQEELKFRAAPKPLSPGAVTHEWRDFLGPNHNAISGETPLLKQLGKTGPPIVWEVTKGEGYAAPAIVSGRVILFHRVENEEIVECLLWLQ